MAGSVNKVILVGNLGKDPEIRRTQDGRPIANLSVATSETWRDKNTGERKEKTEWHRVVIFNEGLCKVVEQYLKKGAKVYIEGALQTRKWTDQSGVEKYSTEVVLQGFNSTLTMLDGRSGGGGGSFGPDDAAAISAPAARSVPRRGVRWRPVAAAATATWTTTFRSKFIGSRCGSLQEAADPAFEHPDQNRIHELIVVGNVEADDPFAIQAGAEFPVQLVAVGLLHDEYDVGPFDLFSGQQHDRAVGDACRVGFDARPGRKDLFGGRAAEAIGAADEKDVGQFVTRMRRRSAM